MTEASTDGGTDWVHALARAWGREPARVRSEPPWQRQRPDPAFAAIAAASAPFRAGTRARAVPDVQFFTSTGQLRAPGELLPGPEDRDAQGYAGRVTARLAPHNWLLSVTHPLLVDFALWARLRDMAARLWRRVGWPALPVTAELAVGHRYTRTAGLALPPRHAGLVWVLAGELTLRLRRENGTTAPAELRGRAGELLYWPADSRYAEGFSEAGGEGCVILRLLVAAEPRAAAAVVKNLLVDAAQQTEAYAEDAVPYLPFPPPLLPDGSVATAPPDQRTATLVRRLLHGPDLARTLRTQWAARCSAAGLVPVPPALPPAPHPTLGLADRIRVTGEIIRLPDVWAVNGHLLPVAGAAGERVRSALPPGRAMSVRELCEEVGAADRSAPVLALLERLRRLRAVDVEKEAAR